MVATSYRKSKTPMTKSAAKNRIAAAIRKKRMTNSSVNKSYFRRPVSKYSNKNAISVLAKQVKQLQFQRNGFKQWHHENFQPLVTNPQGDTYLRPLKSRPYAFMVNDFTPNSEVFYGAPFPNDPTTPHFYAAGRFAIQDPNVTGLADSYNWNIKQGQDTCLTTHYLPIKSTMRFEFDCLNIGPTQKPITVRISLIKLKNNGTSNITAQLPSSLYAYKNLVSDTPLDRNHFNTHHYHTVLSDKWYKFVQPDVVKNDTKKVITCVYNNYSTEPLKPDLSNNPSNQAIYYTVPKKDQVWCIISTDCEDDTRLRVRCERWNTWRDAAGSGS